MAARRESTQRTVGMVIFDWAGTLIDHGSLAPLTAFIELFERNGLQLTTAQARAPMGTSKRAHIEALLSMPEVAEGFRRLHGREPMEQDVNALYADFIPAQLAALTQHDALIDGAERVFAQLRARRILIATTTGYFRDAANWVRERAKRAGMEADCDVCADDVAEGRPAPWMNFACMQMLGVSDPTQVVVVGDTRADVLAARHAGCTSVGVARTGNEVGLSLPALRRLPVDEQNARIERARTTLRDAGAHFVIDSIAELPALLRDAGAELVRRSGAGLRTREASSARMS